MKTKKITPILAGIMYLIVTIWNCVNVIMYANQSKYFEVTINNVIYWIINLGLVVVLLMKRTDISVLVVNALILIFSLFNLMQYFRFLGVLNILPEVAVFAFCIIVFCTKIKLKEKYVTIMSLLPALLFLIYQLAIIISYVKSEYLDVSYYFSDWKSIISIVISFLGILFVGLWIGDIAGEKNIDAENIADIDHTTFNPMARNSTSFSGTIGGADTLKKYKELLDAEVITQEEFEEKKKQILGI